MAGSGRKVQVTMRVDEDVLEAFKNEGEGWQTRMNDALRQWRQESTLTDMLCTYRRPSCAAFFASAALQEERRRGCLMFKAARSSKNKTYQTNVVDVLINLNFAPLARSCPHPAPAGYIGLF